jgi:hypothetical protein
MQRKQVLILALVVLIAVAATATLALAQGPTGSGQALEPLASPGTAFTYQGQLKNSGGPVNGACDFQFGLWDSSSGGFQVSGTTTQTVPSVAVSNGLFSVSIDFGASAFNGNARYLGVAVACPKGAYTAFNSRQPLTPAPLALALPGLYTQQNGTSPNVIGGYSGNVISTTVVGGAIGGGGITGSQNRLWANFATVGGGSGNTVSGDYASVGGGTHNAASATAATVAGGSSNNASGYTATIGGGGSNIASSMYATVGGGASNDVSGMSATIGGGVQNDVNGTSATVGGGAGNAASLQFATVSGGHFNAASGDTSAIGGGESNIAGGRYATVPGGSYNTASGDSSLAAGYHASANHNGTLVWADSTSADFASTAANQFLVRASGGAGINTNSPAANTLTVGGSGIKIGITGTTLAVVQSGTATLGIGGSGVNVYTVTFPSPFPVSPQVLVTVRSDSEVYPDTFAVTTRNVLTSQFRVNVYRVDLAGNSWTQPLKMDWVAWNQ